MISVMHFTALVELRLALSRSVRERRLKLGLSQVELASRLGSSRREIGRALAK